MTREDTELYHTWRNDMEVMRFTNLIHWNQREIDFVDQVTLGSPSAKSYIMLQKNIESPIGTVSLISIDYQNRMLDAFSIREKRTIWEKVWFRRFDITAGLRLLRNEPTPDFA